MTHPIKFLMYYMYIGEEVRWLAKWKGPSYIISLFDVIVCKHTDCNDYTHTRNITTLLVVYLKMELTLIRKC